MKYNNITHTLRSSHLRLYTIHSQISHGKVDNNALQFLLLFLNQLFGRMSYFIIKYYTNITHTLRWPHLKVINHSCQNLTF